MVIEFFGLPGTGKTHYAEKLAKERNSTLITVTKRGERWGRSFLYFLAHPFVVVVFVFEIFRETYSRPALLKHKLFFLFLSALAREQKARTYKDAVVDEGLFLFLLSLYEHPLKRERLEKFKKLLPARNTEVMLVSAPEMTWRARLKERNRTPRHALGDKYQEAWLKVLTKNSSVISTFIKEHFSFQEITNS